jgi:methionine-rich copper-binding protein CopC
MSARWIGALAVLWAAVVLGWSPASAVPTPTHARLYTSSPAAGSLEAQPPAAITLTFTREIAPPASVAVTSPSGRRVGTGDPDVAGRVVTAPVAPREKGTYTVAYQAVSVDGHPMTGQFTFSVGHHSAPYSPAEEGAGGRAAWVVPAAGAGVVLVSGGLVAGIRRSRRTSGRQVD